MEIEVSGSIIHYEDDGLKELPPVLLWNGASCTLRMWDFIVEDLKTEYRFIRFDIRGTGSSIYQNTAPSLFSLEQYGKDANCVLEQLQIDKVTIWSMAWGSRAAIAYCSRNQDRVNNAVLHDASIAKADPTAQKEGAKAAVEKQISKGLKKFEKPANYNFNHQPELVSTALAAAASFDLPSAIKKLSMPVLLVTGDHDPNLASTREIHETLTNSSLKVLENVGHGSILQRPDLCINSFREFQLAQTQSEKSVDKRH